MTRVSMRIRTVLSLALVVVAASCSGGDSKGGPTTPPTPKRFTLAAAVAAGVNGAPATGTVTYDENASVSYALTPAAGHTNLVVLLDGNNVAPSGTIRMDGNHTLIAGADAAPPQTPADQAHVAEVRALATSPTPVAAFQALLDQAAALSDQVGADSVARLYAAIDASFDPVADSSAMRRAHQALGGHLFTIGNSASPALSLARRSVIPAGGTGVSVIYINGVDNSPAEALATLTHLRKVMETHGMGMDGDLRVFLFYNATWTQRPNEVGKCLLAVASVASNSNWVNWAKLALKCTTLADFVRARDQMLDVLGYVPDLASSDAVNLAAAVRRELDAGRAVILLGHSQGTLIAQQALKRVAEGQTDARTAPAACLGSLNVAAPLSYIGGPVARRDGVAVKGTISQDVILWLGFNQDERITTSLSNYYDAFRGSITSPEFTLNPVKLIGDISLAGAYPVIAAFSDTQLHRIEADYLGTDEGRLWLMNRLQGEIAGVSSSCANSAPSQLAIVSGDHQAGAASATLPELLKVRLTNRNGGGVPMVPVAFAVVSGDGHVGGSPVLTDNDGYAATSLKLGTAAETVVEARAAGPAVAPVRFTASLSAGPPAIALTDSIVTVTALAGGSAPAAQTVQVTNGGGGSLNNLSLGTVAYDPAVAGWLTASLAGSTSPTSVSLSVHQGSLAAGSYRAVVPVRSTAPGVTNSPRSIYVLLTVQSNAGPGALRLSMTAVSDSVYANVSVSGPNGYSLSGTVSPVGPKVISGLEAGTYTVSWSDAVCVYQGGCGPISWGPAVRDQDAVVSGGATTSLASIYLPITGYMLVQASGLNDSVYVRVDVAGPGGYANTIAVHNGDTLRLTNLAPGTYAFTWYDSTCAYQGGCARTFHPAARSQSVDLTASTQPLRVSMSYSP